MPPPPSDAKGQSSRQAVGAAMGPRDGHPRFTRAGGENTGGIRRPRRDRGRFSMVRAVRILAVLSLVAGVAAACATFPPAEPGAPSLLTLDDWVAGRNKIWDIAFPAGGQPPLYTENDSGVIFARVDGAERARPLGAVTQFDGSFDPTGEGGLMGIALSPTFNGSTSRRAFVCYSTTSDNRVARFDVNYAAGAFVAL